MRNNKDEYFGLALVVIGLAIMLFRVAYVVIKNPIH
jgi:hypothetical protein